MKGKVVLITGASSGIGAGTAVRFASRGCLLSLTGRSVTRLQDTRNACVQAGAKEDDILIISADLQVFDNLEMIVRKTVDKFGKLDVLINNAAYLKHENFESTTVEDYDKVMNTNLRTVFFLTQLAVPYLIKSQGSVVNMSGVGSQRPLTFSTPFFMGEAAIDHLTRMVALELASKNVRVNSVNPGVIDTPLLTSGVLPIDRIEFSKAYHAMGRSGTVLEVAKAIEFLADNNQSSFVTGVSLLVDGGAFLMGPV